MKYIMITLILSLGVYAICIDQDVSSIYPEGLNLEIRSRTNDGTVEQLDQCFQRIRDSTDLEEKEECYEDCVLKEYFCYEDKVTPLFVNCDTCIYGACTTGWTGCTSLKGKNCGLLCEEKGMIASDTCISTTGEIACMELWAEDGCEGDSTSTHPCLSGIIQHDLSWKCCCMPIEACTDECSILGAKECDGNSYVRTCGYFDQDPCLDWNNQEFCAFGCVGGKCIQKIDKNTKEISRYMPNEAFLISDDDWRSVLSLIPVTTWTGEESWCNRGYKTPEEVCTYPTLIYHKEGSSYDIDSIIHFLQGYSPDYLTISGESNTLDLLKAGQPFGAGIKNIKQISPDTYFSYWLSFKDIVLSEDSYETALLASSYASLINAPLVIKGTTLDSDNIYINRNVICVGDVKPKDSDCKETYSLKELQAVYLDKTSTDKIIMVNPMDLDYKVKGSLIPKKQSSVLTDLYGKTSLSAPVLSGAKHELVISIEDPSMIRSVLKRYPGQKYLTILASPLAIPMVQDSDITYAERKLLEEVDSHVYGNLDSDIFQEIAVGRIFSLTTSDVSSYIARVLFYPGLPKDNRYHVIWPGDIPKTMPTAESISGLLEKRDLVPDKPGFPSTIVFIGNSWTKGGKGFNSVLLDEQNIWLNQSIVITQGSGTCSFDNAADKSLLLCADLIRKGAILHYGAAVDLTLQNFDTAQMFLEELPLSKDIGSAAMAVNNRLSIVDYLPQHVLIGDPTFSPQASRSAEYDISLDYTGKVIEISVPSNSIKLHHDQGKVSYGFYSKPTSDVIAAQRLYKMAQGDNIEYGDLLVLLFALDLGDGQIKDITDVRYEDESTEYSIKQLSPDGSMTFAHDGGIYYFALAHNYGIAGGLIPNHKFKIYLDTGEVIS